METLIALLLEFRFGIVFDISHHGEAFSTIDTLFIAFCALGFIAYLVVACLFAERTIWKLYPINGDPKPETWRWWLWTFSLGNFPLYQNKNSSTENN